MRMSKAFIAAVPLALALIAAVVVPLALSAAAGTFGFDSWPTSPAAPPRDNAVVIEQPLELSGRSRSGEGSRPPIVRDDRSRGSAKVAHGALVAQAGRSAPPQISKAPSGHGGSRRPGSDAGSPQRATGGPSGVTADETPTGPAPAPAPTPAP